MNVHTALLESELQSFANKLDPSSQDCVACKREVDSLIRYLNEECAKFSVSRIIVGGGSVKNTNIAGKLEADVMVLLDREPPYQTVLDSIRNVVSERYKWQQAGSGIPAVDRLGVISLTLSNNITVNIYVGKNLVKAEERRLGEAAQLRRQHERSIEWLMQFKNQHSKLSAYSICLAPAHPNFVAEQVKDKFVHSIVKLCKKWDDCIQGVPHIHDRSSTIELLAIAAAGQAKKQGKKTLIEGFRCFLESWTEIAASSFSRCFDYAEKKGLYVLRDVPHSVSDSRPLLLHPADPFNNKLQLFKAAGVLPALSKCAQHSLNRLKLAEAGKLSDLGQIFAMQTV